MSVEILALQEEISTFLNKNKNLSLNALGQKCGVSEPTLRRIMKGQLKKAPKTTTVIEILSYIHKTKTVSKLIEVSPAALRDKIK